MKKEAIYCSNCGEEIGRGNYCANCGHEIGDSKEKGQESGAGESDNRYLTGTTRVIVGIVLIFVVFSAIGQFGEESSTINQEGLNDRQDTDTQMVESLSQNQVPASMSVSFEDGVDQALRTVRDKMNERLPIVLENGVRLDNIETGDGSITYNYTITSDVNASTRNLIKSSEFKGIAKNRVCTDNLYETFREYSVHMNYKYFLPSGKLIRFLSIQPETCP